MTSTSLFVWRRSDANSVGPGGAGDGPPGTDCTYEDRLSQRALGLITLIMEVGMQIGNVATCLASHGPGHRTTVESASWALAIIMAADGC